MHNYTTLPPVIANYCEPTKYMIPCHFISLHPIPGQSVLNNNGTRSYFGPNEWMSDCVAANSIPLCTTFPAFYSLHGLGDLFWIFMRNIFIFNANNTQNAMMWCGRNEIHPWKYTQWAPLFTSESNKTLPPLGRSRFNVNLFTASSTIY